jgi:anti-anti-sigma factor
MFERTRQGAVDLIKGDQPIITNSLAEFSEVLDRCVSQRQPRVVVDMSSIPLLDSRGLELLVDCQRQSIARGGCIKLASPSPLCRDILTATNVIAMFDVFDNALEAAGSFAR